MTDLPRLLREMRPEMQAGVFVFCSLPQDEGMPAGVTPVLVFRESEGMTLVMLREEAERAGLEYRVASRMITLTVYSSLEAVGFLAAITERLAAAGISVNAVSGFYHDHLFVPEEFGERAVELLRAFSRGTFGGGEGGGGFL